MQKDIIRVLKYFELFLYYPSIDEIYLFLEKRTTKENLYKILKRLENSKKISYFNGFYTRGEYNIKSKVKSHPTSLKLRGTRKLKERISQKKINNWRFRAYVKLISLFSQVKLIAISGSVAMKNANKADDIDLFIITKSNRLWTARFLIILLAIILGIKRSRIEVDTKDKVCLNLFFDENNLEVPDFKKNYYVAHEILQMKPVFSKQNTYEDFLETNKWIIEIFPNFKPKITKKHLSRRSFNRVGNLVEKILKIIQLFFINKNKTTEIISETQLWFFPDDFEKKLPKWAKEKHK